MALEATVATMRAWAEATSRLNWEQRAASEADRKELAAIEKKIRWINGGVENGGGARGMMDRPRALKARQGTSTAKFSAAPAALPNVHPNIADIYRCKVERLTAAVDSPTAQDEAAATVCELIGRVVLIPGAAWGELDAKLGGALGTTLKWTRGEDRHCHTVTRVQEMPVPVLAGA